MASNEEIQFELLKDLYESADSHLLAFFRRNSLIEEVTDKIDASEKDVKYALNILEDDGYIQRDGTTIELTAKGIVRLEESGYDTHLDAEVQERILQKLESAERDDPDYPEVPLDELSTSLDIERPIIDENVLYLDSRYDVKLEHINQTAYASITSSGRDRVN